MMCRSRSWNNRGDITEHDKVLFWDICVGKYPIIGEIGPEITSTSGKGGNMLRDTTEIFMFLSSISLCFQDTFITVIE